VGTQRVGLRISRLRDVPLTCAPQMRFAERAESAPRRSAARFEFQVDTKVDSARCGRWVPHADPPRHPCVVRPFPYDAGEFPYGRRSKVGSRPLHFLCVPVARTPTRPRAPAAGAPARYGARNRRPTCATGSIGGSATAPCGRPTPWRPACPPRTASYSHSDNNRSAPLSAYAQRATGCRL
jgi:hypothetical protein